MEIVLKPLTPELIDHLADQNLTAEEITTVKLLVGSQFAEQEIKRRTVNGRYNYSDEPDDTPSPAGIFLKLSMQNERTSKVIQSSYKLGAKLLSLMKSSKVKDDRTEQIIREKLQTILFSDGEKDGIPADAAKALCYMRFRDCLSVGPYEMSAEDKAKYLAVIDGILESEARLETSPEMFFEAEATRYFITKEKDRFFDALGQIVTNEGILRDHPGVVIDALVNYEHALPDGALTAEHQAVLKRNEKMAEALSADADVIEKHPFVALSAAQYFVSSVQSKVRPRDEDPKAHDKAKGNLKSVKATILLRFGLAEEVKVSTQMLVKKAAEEQQYS